MRTETKRNYFAVIVRDTLKENSAWTELLGTNEQTDFVVFDDLAQVENFVNGKTALNYLDDYCRLEQGSIKGKVLGVYNILTDDVLGDLYPRVTNIILSRY